jgi:type II restriction enzyme
VKFNILKRPSLDRRIHWVAEIRKLSGHFGEDTSRLDIELQAEIQSQGLPTLIDHLRLCGAIPESYGHDSSEEKLYSKYTDKLLQLAFERIGFHSLVIKERADAADVECVAKDYSFVADAKAFRLSRTAKNQKDFKVGAMHGWKRGKPYAMVVCPIYQLPAKASQIYHQAASQNVCIFTYSHLSLLLAFSQLDGPEKTQKLLRELFTTVEALNPSKHATDYWIPINRMMLGFSHQISGLWQIEKEVSAESIVVAKEEALTFLSAERERIARMSREEAIKELIREQNIDNKIAQIESVADNEIMNLT